MSYPYGKLCAMPRGFRGGERRAQVVARLIDRDGDWCGYCGFTFTADGIRACTIDHVTPRSQGGTNELDNLRLACWYCNAWRNRLPDGEYERSTLLTQRRRRAYRAEMVASGRWLPKRAFHHPGIHWSGEGLWECADCCQGSSSGDGSPATVPCAPWCDQDRGQWVVWWRDPFDPPDNWPNGNRTAREEPMVRELTRDTSVQPYPLSHAG
jgi:hypothetical protein